MYIELEQLASLEKAASGHVENLIGIVSSNRDDRIAIDEDSGFIMTGLMFVCLQHCYWTVRR